MFYREYSINIYRNAIIFLNQYQKLQQFVSQRNSEKKAILHIKIFKKEVANGNLSAKDSYLPFGNCFSILYFNMLNQYQFLKDRRTCKDNCNSDDIFSGSLSMILPY